MTGRSQAELVQQLQLLGVRRGADLRDGNHGRAVLAAAGRSAEHPPGRIVRRSWPLRRANLSAAAALAAPHGPDSPVGRVHELNGQVLLLGVTHSENTTLHLAESIARVPYSVEHPRVVEIDGVPRTVMIAETDHCCARFRLADGWLRGRGLQREGKLGNADARLSRSRDIVAVAIEHLRADPLVFLCPPERGCAECDAARASVRT